MTQEGPTKVEMVKETPDHLMDKGHKVLTTTKDLRTIISNRNNIQNQLRTSTQDLNLQHLFPRMGM